MSACEKCWADAGGNADSYSRLIVDRNVIGRPPLCSPEDQAGPDATECPECHRLTLHQHTGEPMCGCRPDNSSEQP